METPAPVLYSFRRCPYAMRARLAIKYSQKRVELREVKLFNKPDCMLAFSPKGTVPVLVLNPEAGHEIVIDESEDIMFWCLGQHDPDHWFPQDLEDKKFTQFLLDESNGEFKEHLDRYKYFDRHPENDQEHYRTQGEIFLKQLDQRLQKQKYLCGDTITLADMCIAPFIRQFANVDFDWFADSEYKALLNWLNEFTESELFKSIMKKYEFWANDDEAIYFP